MFRCYLIATVQVQRLQERWDQSDARRATGRSERGCVQEEVRIQASSAFGQGTIRSKLTLAHSQQPISFKVVHPQLTRYNIMLHGSIHVAMDLVSKRCSNLRYFHNIDKLIFMCDFFGWTSSGLWRWSIAWTCLPTTTHIFSPTFPNWRGSTSSLQW